MKRVVVAGHICLDIIPDIDHAFELVPGRLFEVGAPTIGTGGAVSNTGVALHLLGVPTTLMGKVGDDSFGQTVLDVLGGYGSGLAQGMGVVPGVVTSYTVVVSIPGTDRIFLHCPGANGDFTASDIDYATVAEADLFHFGYPALMAALYADNGAETVSLFQQAKGTGVTTSLDLAMPDPTGPSGQANWATVLSRALPYVDVFMPSGDELLYALDRDRFGDGDSLSAADLAPLAEQLLDMGAAIAGIKLGARGLYVRTGVRERLEGMGRGAPADAAQWAERELWFPVFQVADFAGATGAGDTTIAGFLAGLLHGRTLEDSGRFANAVGACNVEAPDALSGIKSWDETWARLGAGWPHAPFMIEEAGWRRNASTGVWHGPRDPDTSGSFSELDSE